MRSPELSLLAKTFESCATVRPPVTKIRSRPSLSETSARAGGQASRLASTSATKARRALPLVVIVNRREASAAAGPRSVEENGGTDRILGGRCLWDDRDGNRLSPRGRAR